MAIIWVIENAEHSTSVANALMGDFAVRGFRSLASFSSLARVRRRGLPDLIVVDLPSLEQNRATIEVQVDQMLPGVKRIFFAPVNVTPNGRDECHRPVRSIELAALIEGFLFTGSNSGGSRRKVSYQRLTLDIDHQQLIDESGDVESLSGKESRLLRFFFENSGRRVSREQIRETVWQGAAVSHRTIDSHISRLRRRVEPFGMEITNIYGGEFLLR